MDFVARSRHPREGGDPDIQLNWLDFRFRGNDRLATYTQKTGTAICVAVPVVGFNLRSWIRKNPAKSRVPHSCECSYSTLAFAWLRSVFAFDLGGRLEQRTAARADTALEFGAANAHAGCREGFFGHAQIVFRPLDALPR
jgi:hypothetical protein